MEENINTNEQDEVVAPRSIKKNYLYNALAKIFALLIPILVTPYLARVLEPDGNGVISFIASIVSYFVIASNIGIETYGQKYISSQRNNKVEIKKFFYEIFFLRALLTGICLVVYLVTFVCFLGGENYLLYAVYGISLLGVALDFTWFFQGVEDFKKIAFANVISKVIYIILIFVFVKTKTDILIASLITVITSITPYLFLIPFLRRYLHNVKLNERIQPFKHFKECMVYFVPTIAIQIYTILDKTMIGLITNSDFENGYYEQAEKIVKLPLTVITTMNIIMRSRISYYFTNKEFDKIKTLTKKSTCFSLMLSIPIMLGSIVISRKFVPFYLGPGYDECIILIYILAPLIFIISLSNLLGTHYYTPYDLQRTSNKFLIIGAVVNVILNIPLIYFFKSRGAAIASVSAELVITILYIIFARNFFTLKEFFLCGYKYCIAGLIMFGVTFTLDYYLPGSIWYLLLEISCGISVYFVILLLLRDRFLLDNIKKVWSDLTAFRRK